MVSAKKIELDNFKNTKILCEDLFRSCLEYEITPPAVTNIYRDFPKAIPLNLNTKPKFNLLESLDYRDMFRRLLLVMKLLVRRYNDVEEIKNSPVSKNIDNIIKISELTVTKGGNGLGIDIKSLVSDLTTTEKKLKYIKELLRVIPAKLNISVAIIEISKEIKDIAIELIEPEKKAIDTLGFLLGTTDIYVLFSNDYFDPTKSESALIERDPTFYDERMSNLSNSTTRSNTETISGYSSRTTIGTENSHITLSVNSAYKEAEMRCTYCKEVIEFGFYEDDNLYLSNTISEDSITAPKIHLRCAYDRRTRKNY